MNEFRLNGLRHWICENCGQKNEVTRKICLNCGKEDSKSFYD